MSEPILAWHFVGATLRDGRPIPADGELLKQAGRIVPCKNGLHASERVLNALKYAPGATLCRVRLSGARLAHDGDKHAASQRTILWRIDATEILRKFARLCALDVIDLWDAPGVVRQFLETGDLALAQLSSLAFYAAASACYVGASAADAASYAADAATDAADAYNAANAASAARAADDAAVGVAVRKLQNERLMKMVEEYAATLVYAV